MLCIKCKKEAPDGLYCALCGARQDAPIRNHRRRGNGTGTAFKRGRTWYAQITDYKTTAIVNGIPKTQNHRRTKGGFATKKDALAYLETLRESSKRKMPCLIDLYTQYENSDMQKLSSSRQHQYKAARRRLEPIIGRPIDSLTTADLQNIINSTSESYSTARAVKDLLSQLYKIAMIDQFVPANLALFLTLPDSAPKESQPFTPDEVQKIWQAYSNGELFAGYLLIMIYSGMMPGELMQCRKSMIDFDKCEIWGAGLKTAIRKEKPIIFAECVKVILSNLCEQVPGNKLYFKSMSQFYTEYYRCVKNIGIRMLPPYACRHTTGTEAARQNLAAPIVQKIMRHARITTTQQYIHLGDAEAKDGLNSLFNDPTANN